MKQSVHFIQNADTCARLAERATDEPMHQRYRLMERRGVRLRGNRILA
jgi:hypothetical protein